MALPNPYEVEIPSDSEDEDEYIEAVWVEEPAECPGKFYKSKNFSNV